MSRAVSMHIALDNLFSVNLELKLVKSTVLFKRRKRQYKKPYVIVV